MTISIEKAAFVPPWKSRVLVWLILVFLAVFVGWASQAELDELVRADGRVIPSQQLQVVQNLEGGIVSEIAVVEGELVQPGQVLIRIDDTQFASELIDNEKQHAVLRMQVERIKAELSGQQAFNVSEGLSDELPAIARQEETIFASRIEKKKAERAILLQTIAQNERELKQAESSLNQSLNELDLAKKELEIVSPLRREGVISAVELIKVQKEVARLEGKVAEREFSIPSIQDKIVGVQKQLNELEANYAAESQSLLSENLAKLSRLEQASKALQDRVERTTVRSPVKGTIKQVFVSTKGGVVKPGMDIISIVPLEDVLLIEAKLKPADIARIYPGQPAMVKFTAYDDAVHGGLAAKVKHISADSIIDQRGDSHYLVRMETVQNFLGTEEAPLPIIPGMLVNVDILAGKRTVMQYLIKPLVHASRVALTE